MIIESVLQFIHLYNLYLFKYYRWIYWWRSTSFADRNWFKRTPHNIKQDRGRNCWIWFMQQKHWYFKINH